MRVLIAEDDLAIRSYVAQGMREAGYAVDAVADGNEALAAASAFDYDLAILDIGIPAINGLQICKRLRGQARNGLGILFLTARDSLEDRVIGLDSGADDYIVKPFAFAELLARVRALLRRGGGEKPVLQVGALT